MSRFINAALDQVSSCTRFLRFLILSSCASVHGCSSYIFLMFFSLSHLSITLSDLYVERLLQIILGREKEMKDWKSEEKKRRRRGKRHWWYMYSYFLYWLLWKQLLVRRGLFGGKIFKNPAWCISSATVKKNTEIQFTNTGQTCSMSTSTVFILQTKNG